MVQIRTEHPLRKWRKDAGLTLEQAAERVPTVRQVWSDWERGRRRPSSDAMRRLFELTAGKVQPNDFYDLSPIERDAA